MSNDGFEFVDVKVDITAGDDFKLNMEFPTVVGSERVYWAAAAYGAVKGTAEASKILVETIPDEAGMVGEILKAAGMAAEKVG